MNIKKREREKDGSEWRKMREMGESALDTETRGIERGRRDMTREESEREPHFLFFSCVQQFII